MAHRHRLKAAIRHQSSVEWTFPKAHRYWDDCGKLVTKIEDVFPGLQCKALDQQGFRFEATGRPLSNAVFFWDKARIGQTGIGDSGLAEAAERFWSAVSEGLSVKKVDRFGHRTWLVFQTDRPADAIRWLEGHRLWKFDEETVTGRLGVPTSLGFVVRSKIDSPIRALRLEVNAATLRAATGEIHGVTVDVDLSVESPGNEFASPSAYGHAIQANIDYIREFVEPIFLR